MDRLQSWLDAGFRAMSRLSPAADRVGRDDDAMTTYRSVCRAAYERAGWPGLAWTVTAEWTNLAVCAMRARVSRGRIQRGRAIGDGSPEGLGGRAMFDDIRHAWRRVRAHPMGALLAISMLALAIGMTAAMATVVDALILRPAPFRDVATLAWLAVGKPGDTSVGIPVGEANAWRRSGAFAAIYAASQEGARIGDGDDAPTFAGARLSPGFLEDLGVRPLFGRTFIAGEGRPGTDDMALLSEHVWRSQFGGNPAIVGTRVRLSGASVLIVGILPDRFRFPFATTSVWRPIDIDDPPTSTDQHFPLTKTYVYARLAPGVPRADAARLATAALHDVEPKAADQIVDVQPIGFSLDKYSDGTVRSLAAGVGLVFLVLCANVANLMLARLAVRRREFATCSALGASRTRLLRQAVIEQVLVATVASIVGVGVAAGLVALSNIYLPADIVRATLNPLAVDLRVVAATSVCGLVAVAIAGLVPAWIGTRHDLAFGLRSSSTATTDARGSRRATTLLLVGEIGLAVALAVAAGLQLRSFVNLLDVDQGFDLRKLVTFRIALPARAFTDGVQRRVVAENLRAAVLRLPGVEGVTLSQGVPSVGGNGISFYDVQPDTAGAAPVHLVWLHYDVAPEFFSVLGIRLLQGRSFERGDGPDVAVISQSMASALWPGRQAVVGHTLSFGKQTLQIVGVTNDIRNPLKDPRSDQPEVYQPLFTPGAGRDDAGQLDGASVSLTVRCGVGCPPIDILRRELASASALAVVRGATRLSDAYADTLARPRTGAAVTIAFAAIALLTVGGGLFAVLSRVVLRRQREFGIRLALGATPRDVGRLVERSSWTLGAVGMAIGVGLAWAMARVLAAVQFEVQFADPTTWVVVVGAVALTVVAAAWLPARRAMRADPIVLLREG